MSAGAIMIRHAQDTARATDRTGLPMRPSATAYRLRAMLRRLDPGVAVPIGFAAAMVWAFVSSLLLGLGTGSASRTAAWLWLGGELLIGALVFLALTLGLPSGRDGA